MGKKVFVAMQDLVREPGGVAFWTPNVQSPQPAGLVAMMLGKLRLVGMEMGTHEALRMHILLDQIRIPNRAPPMAFVKK